MQIWIWRSGSYLPAELAFDHRQIIQVGVERLRNKANYSVLPCYFLPELFTYAEMQATFELVLGKPLPTAAFRRKVEALGMLEESNQIRRDGSHRPSRLFRLARHGEGTAYARSLSLPNA